MSMRLVATMPWLMRYNELESMSAELSRWMDRYGQSFLRILRLIRCGIVFEIMKIIYFIWEICPSNC